VGLLIVDRESLTNPQQAIHDQIIYAASTILARQARSRGAEWGAFIIQHPAIAPGTSQIVARTTPLLLQPLHTVTRRAHHWVLLASLHPPQQPEAPRQVFLIDNMHHQPSITANIQAWCREMLPEGYSLSNDPPFHIPPQQDTTSCGAYVIAMMTDLVVIRRNANPTRFQASECHVPSVTVYRNG
jgi:hypothetical protein